MNRPRKPAFVLVSARIVPLAFVLLNFRQMVTLLVMIGVVSMGFFIGLIATAMAPVGYQDESGFHFGNEQGSSAEEFAYPMPQPKLV